MPAPLARAATGLGPLGNFDLDESPDAPPVSEQIIAALMANAGKVLDLFRSWDNDGDGTDGEAPIVGQYKHMGSLLRDLRQLMPEM